MREPGHVRDHKCITVFPTKGFFKQSGRNLEPTKSTLMFMGLASYLSPGACPKKLYMMHALQTTTIEISFGDTLLPNLE